MFKFLVMNHIIGAFLCSIVSFIFFGCDRDFEIGSHILVRELRYILYTKSESFKVN
jgi:hypothetical protein